MGQYFFIANLDKQEYLHPHDFGEGLKLMEFGLSSCSILTALTVLLADGNGRGGGDLDSDNPIIGSWAGDRIVVIGDYSDMRGEFNDNISLFEEVDNEYTNISKKALSAICDDDEVRRYHNSRDFTFAYEEFRDTMNGINQNGTNY